MASPDRNVDAAAPAPTADVAVIGLGRVGLPLALSFADRGLRVVGVDNDPGRLGALSEGRMPFAETGAQELLERVVVVDFAERFAHARARKTELGLTRARTRAHANRSQKDNTPPTPTTQLPQATPTPRLSQTAPTTPTATTTAATTQSGGGSLQLSERVADAAQARHIVITLGTPSFSHIEIDMRDIRSALDDLLGVLGPGHSLILRSTVAPGTTEFVAGYLAKHRGFQIGEDVFVAHCPERIAAGRFLEEIDTLPCIVGGVGARSGEVAAELFGVFAAPIVQTTPVQAELAKIWTNILRYATFALPNLLMMDCERYGANVFEVIDLVNRDYPRGGLAQPGLTAGTCLRKDFAFSEERSNAPGMLLAVSRVNESVPLFLVEGMRRRLGALADRKVAVLGLAFKADTDDERDSLAHKLVRLLERELTDVAVHDPHVATPTASFDDAVRAADAVVVAANHSEFRDPRALAQIAARAGEDCLIVDPWNCWGTGQVFAYAAELTADPLPIADLAQAADPAASSRAGHLQAPSAGAEAKAGQDVPPRHAPQAATPRGRSQTKTPQNA